MASAKRLRLTCAKPAIFQASALDESLSVMRRASASAASYCFCWRSEKAWVVSVLLRAALAERVGEVLRVVFVVLEGEAFVLEVVGALVSRVVFSEGDGGVGLTRRGRVAPDWAAAGTTDASVKTRARAAGKATERLLDFIIRGNSFISSRFVQLLGESFSLAAGELSVRMPAGPRRFAPARVSSHTEPCRSAADRGGSPEVSDEHDALGGVHDSAPVRRERRSPLGGVMRQTP